MRTGHLLLVSGRPSQEELVGLIPALLAIGHRDDRPADLPLPFHGPLPDETPHRQGRPPQRPGRSAAPAASSTGAGPIGSGKTCQL